MNIWTKADLLKELENFDDRAVIYFDEASAKELKDNYLFSIKNPTKVDDAKDYDIMYNDED